MQHESRTAVVMAIDDRYALPLTVLLRSISRSWAGAEPPRIILLGLDLARPTAGLLERCAHSLGLSLDQRPLPAESFAGLPTTRHLSEAAYGRLSIPEHCPDLDQALYLDADLVVFRSIHELLQMDLERWPVAAVRDVYSPFLGSPLCLPGWEVPVEMRLRPYFNSGVMVMDLRTWRRERIASRVLSFARDHARHLVFADQDAMNAVLAGRWLALDPRWNVPTISELPDSPAISRELEADPWILHFTGPKPWWRDYPNGRNRDRFTRFLR